MVTKFDDNKPPVGLIPRSATLEEAYVLAFGAQKYGTHNWRQGMKWQRLINASMRHILAFNEGEDFDPESGLCHLAHARCCLSFLIEYMTTHPEFDDRHKYHHQCKAEEAGSAKTVLPNGSLVATMQEAFDAGKHAARIDATMKSPPVEDEEELPDGSLPLSIHEAFQRGMAYASKARK